MYLVFDIGGTKIRLAFSKDKSTLFKITTFPSPKEFMEGMRLFKKFSCEENITAVAGGIAGPLDREKTKSENPPNLKGWAGKPLKQALVKIFGTKVYLENDAALTGLGEATFGAGRGHKIVVYLTLSTGIGGVRIVDGEIDINALGFEPGHQIIDYKSKLICGCGGFGHLEAHIGGASIEKQYKKRAEEINGRNFWDKTAQILAYGLNNTIVHWSPEIVILGGSLTKRVPIDKVNRYLKQVLTIFPQPPLIKKAELKDSGGLYGALALLNKKLGE